MDYDFMGPIVQAVLVNLVNIFVPVILGYLALQARKGLVKFKTRTEYELAVKIIRNLVLAAEQLGVVGEIEDFGEVKKRWVIDRAEAALAKRGVKIDLDEISDMIEAAVKFELNKLREESAG